MKNLSEWIRHIFDALLFSWAGRVIRALGALVGLGLRLWPDAEGTVLSIATIAGALMLLTFVIDITLFLSRRLADEATHFLLTRKYGFQYTKLTVKSSLNKSDGSMSVRRRVHLKTRVTLTHIRHYLHALMDPDEGSVEVVNLERFEPEWIDMTPSKVSDLSFQDRLVIEVRFDPPLEPGDTAVYELSEKYPCGSFATSAEEMREAELEWEFLSWDISRPTKLLEFQVSVPTSLGPSGCTHDVWYGGGQIHQTHRREWEATRDCFKAFEGEADNLILQINRPYPVLGLLYALKWKYE